MKKKILPFIFFFFVSLFFFYPVFQNKLPIPADTIIGLYHPFRDLYVQDYPNGIPFKNFLITDPVRQQYPWRSLVIESIQNLSLPLWNPYTLSGTPLLATFQSAVFYPLNIFPILLPFEYAWTLLVGMQIFLLSVFTYLYIRNLGLNNYAAILGSIAFTFSGFMVSWLEWNTIGHTALWLPVILLSIDKVFSSKKGLIILSLREYTLHLNLRSYLLWLGIFIFSLCASFFAGHLQTFFYLFVFSLVYLLARWWQNKHDFRLLAYFFVSYLLFVIITFVQWFPTLQLISLSARNIDLDWQKIGWFLPWKHLVQFVVPDFFGNPTTLNYWGEWNYGEFIGYVGVVPFLAALIALFTRRDKKTLFFGISLLVALIFMLPTWLAVLPYKFDVPFLSTAQPTRMLFVVDFCLALLAALGLDLVLKKRKYSLLLVPSVILLSIFLAVWFLILVNPNDILSQNIAVAKRNAILPTAIFFGSIGLLLLQVRFKKNLLLACVSIILALSLFDSLRFAYKYISFSSAAYLYPNTTTTSFLQKNIGVYRIMSTDQRILPPNFSVMYKIPTIEGYDPLYLKSYGELMAASERGEPNIKPPFGFNRIITPQRFESDIIDLLGVKYILSFSDLTSTSLEKVHQEGITMVFENKEVIPRVFFVKKVNSFETSQEVIEYMFSLKKDIATKAAILAKDVVDIEYPEVGSARIIEYENNNVFISTKNNSDGFLVFTDSYYPTWKAELLLEDGNRQELKLHKADYAFRGIFVPKGEHVIRIYNTFFK